LLRKYTQEDMLASGVRVALSVAGPVGTIIGEFLTQFVPQQRLDRLTDYTEQLHDRLHGLEEEFRTRLQTSAAFASFVEQATVAAVRQPSVQRRRDLAELVKSGLSRNDVEMIEHEAILRVLERLNDVQLLILMRYGAFRRSFGNPELEAFVHAHADVFPNPPTYGDNDDTLRRWAMYSVFEDELVQLNLLRDTEGIAKSSPQRKLGITPFGKMLLRGVGCPTVDD
jgi:hypothetical protein